MRPLEWVSKLLERHGLVKPDGRPLYQYRVSNDEFNELTELLKLSAIMGVNNIQRMISWDAAFVIYASEWWRLHYRGKWGWDGIFQSVGINYSELSTARRNELIEFGLNRWRREVRLSDGSRKFLGTIATEGGLPLHQLFESGGWLKNLLQPVLRRHVMKGISIVVLIESYSEFIPRSYRSSELKSVLADIAEAVVALRSDQQLMDKDSPVDWLDSHFPGWREQFPIPLDDAAGRSLLGDLIDTASKAKSDNTSRNPFEVERYLIRAESSAPELVVQIEMPTFVGLDQLNINTDKKLSLSSFDVEVFEPNGTSWSWCRGFQTQYKNKQAIKFSGRTFFLKGNNATKELRLRFKVFGEIIFETEVINGDVLDSKLPWLFRKVDEQWLYYGSASQSINDNSALVYLPNTLSCRPMAEATSICELGNIFSGTIMELSGSLQCQGDDEQFKLSSCSENSIVQYHLTGKRFEYASKPSQTFVGLPDLVETNVDSGRVSRYSGALLVAKPLGLQTQWRRLSQMSSGIHEVRLLDEQGNILFRQRIGVLPENFSLKLQADKNLPCEGHIQFSGVQNFEIKVFDQDISANIEKKNESTILHVKAVDTPPRSIEVSFLNFSKHRDFNFVVPFPSKGALLFDASDKQTPFSLPLYLSNIRGFRIKVFDDKFHKGEKIKLSLSLLDSQMSHEDVRDIFIQRDLTLSKEMTEFSISDWRSSIETLMGVSTNLDSRVKITLELHGQEQFSAKVYRYENQLTVNWADGVLELDEETMKRLSLDSLKQTAVSALNLNQPEEKISDLEPIVSNGAPMGAWDFTLNNRKDGLWMLYPAVNSELKFRPILWVVGDPAGVEQESLDHIDSLPKAVRINDQNTRNIAIRRVLKGMAIDFDHKSWGYLNELWEKTSHLPLATFDVWSLASSEPAFLACLLVRDKSGLIEKFEKELPVIWELVKLSDWKVALISYKLEVSKKLDDRDLTNELLKKQINKIQCASTSMVSIAEILRVDLLGEKSPELNIMKQPINAFLENALSDQFQQLLRNQSDNHWPSFLKGLISRNSRTLPNTYTSIISPNHDFQTSIVYLPFLLAWRVLSEDGDDWEISSADVFKIQQLKDFDDDWFSVVFQYLSGWLSQQNTSELS